MRFVAAFRFLTVIPLPIRREATPEQVGGSVVYFPAVGLIIGLISVAVWWLMDSYVPPPLNTALLLVAMVLINGALHLDGFIDTCDGLAGNKTVEERWRVMRDSRVGAFGIVGAVLLILAKYLALDTLAGSDLFVASLLLMPVVSRWAIVYAIMAYPYARPSGLGTVFKQQMNWRKFAVATAFALAVSVGLSAVPGAEHDYLFGLAPLVGVWIVISAWAAYLKWKFAGLTGDSYGAINEVAEVGVLIIANVLVFNGWLGG
ncbi:MAG: cobalamin 5'-phosphate synthase [Chloroflexi bacterium RBG_16_57_8]|nr:MAG: cobalamin 5'-phosphate synthase [Chloroflexi bacterium RBG_16_57_8]